MRHERFSIESKIAILEKNVPLALEYLSDCTICPRECHVDRTTDDSGECGMPAELGISSANLHHGEEPPISGTGGSGTIFLSGCNLHCQYCQNYPISQYRNGEFYSSAEAASMMIDLEKRGAHNINFVTPSHYVPQLMEAMLIAYKTGLTMPIVYNSSGYDSLEMLKLLDGIIDIYMPDMRYDDPSNSAKYSDVTDYPEINRIAIREMHRQVGVLRVEDEIAVQGLLIRHLVLPKGISGSKVIFDFIAGEISAETFVAVMSQFFPAYNACNHPDISKRLTQAEYDEAIAWFDEAGLANGYIQPYFG
ncbi:MAG: 4Fe-4S cluster-binding domain-containing protein [candidate division Zixibacteria bacterium]|nr:4Fe-4S cluster-binding domain-containing protein [candidate division Zixibacteria bacterium]